MFKTAISVLVGFVLVGCATYKPQTLPDASKIVSQQKLASLEERNSSSSKSLSAIAHEVILYNPDLRAMRYDRNISDAVVLNAGLLPDPSLGFSIAAPIGGSGVSNALGVGVGWSLGSLFTRSTEVNKAQAERNVTKASYMWQVHLSVANALVLAGRLHYLQEQRTIAAKNFSLLQSLSKTTHQKILSHDATLTNSPQILMLDALDAEAKINDQIASTQYELNYQLGVSPSKTFTIESFKLEEIDPKPQLLFQEALQKRSDLVARRFAYQASDELYRRNLLAQFPSFSLGLNWSSDTSKVQTFGPSVTFDLPLWNRNRGGVALSSALRDKEKETYTAALKRTQNDIVALTSAIHRNQVLLTRAKEESKENEKLLHALEKVLKSGNVTLSDYAVKMNEIYLKALWIVGLKQTLFEQQIALALASGSNTILGEIK